MNVDLPYADGTVAAMLPAGTRRLSRVFARTAGDAGGPDRTAMVGDEPGMESGRRR